MKSFDLSEVSIVVQSVDAVVDAIGAEELLKAIVSKAYDEDSRKSLAKALYGYGGCYSRELVHEVLNVLSDQGDMHFFRDQLDNLLDK